MPLAAHILFGPRLPIKRNYWFLRQEYQGRLEGRETLLMNPSRVPPPRALVEAPGRSG